MYSADEDGVEWTLVTGRRRRARIPADNPGRSMREVVDISSGSEREYDDRRPQIVPADRRRHVSKTCYESPSSISSASAPEVALWRNQFW